jgi:hypothetical protein
MLVHEIEEQVEEEVDVGEGERGEERLRATT